MCMQIDSLCYCLGTRPCLYPLSVGSHLWRREEQNVQCFSPEISNIDFQNKKKHAFLKQTNRQTNPPKQLTKGYFITIIFKDSSKNAASWHLFDATISCCCKYNCVLFDCFVPAPSFHRALFKKSMPVSERPQREQRLQSMEKVVEESDISVHCVPS